MEQLLSMNLGELTDWLKAQGFQAFRGKQLYEWLMKGASFDEMTNLPKDFRAKMAQTATANPVRIRDAYVSKLDGTEKYLYELEDGNLIEGVLMRYHHGNTVCISSEVGCAMGCAFCASTIGGLVRRLSAGEMLDEVMFTELDSGQTVSNIVLMGIGEPLDNFDNVCRFLSLINSGEGRNIGMRHISLSTCGVVPRILELAESKLQLTLSVSLHAPDDETRSRIMPVNRRWPVDELLDACRVYYDKTGRRISFEYAMIRDVNDSPEAARLLLRKLKGLPAHVNLIPLNHVEESPLKPSERGTVMRFQKLLEEQGVACTVRRTLGSDIDASCGQLRKKYAQKAST